VDLFIAVGPFMAMAAEEFSRRRGEAVAVGDSGEARRILLEKYKTEDTILIKGSRSMQMERVIDPSENGRPLNSSATDTSDAKPKGLLRRGTGPTLNDARLNAI
jgi:hypothetical protein